MKKNITALFVIAALLVGCGNRQAKDAHATPDTHSEDASTEEAHDHGDAIVFTKCQAEAAGVQVEDVKPEAFNNIIKTAGQIQSAQGDEATLVATSNGIVSFVKSSIAEGAAVKQGESVVTISAKNLLDGDPSAKVKIAYETAKKEYQRAEGLVRDKIISTKEFEQVRMRYETAKSSYEAQASDITSGGVGVKAPIGGYVKSRLVNQGDYVSVGQPIVTISQNKRLQLRAEVSEKQFNELKNISGANFKMAYGNKVYKLSDLNGRLLSFGKTASGQSFYVPVTFEFDNIGDIIPGAFSEVYLLASPRQNVISVPVSALTEEQGLYFVYLKICDEEYKKQEVTVGQNNGERIEVLSGLKEGDKVVVNGVFQVKLAATSSVIPDGHNH